MLHLREMKDQEFPIYCDYFIADYSDEIVLNYGHSKEVATDLAKKDLKRHFPDGLNNSEHHLLCLELQNAAYPPIVIGYLWHSNKDDEGATFIYDFYVSDEYRGKGYGKEAIKLFESLLMTMGVTQIKLRVAFQNKRALTLYQDVGFCISGYNMSKRLTYPNG